MICTKATERSEAMKSDLQDKALFVSFCIEQYAKAKHISTKDAVDLFEQYGYE